VLEIADNSGLVRRIIAGLIDLTTALVRPLRRERVRHYLLRAFILFYVAFILYLHFIGYRSWRPEFHRVHEEFRTAAIESIPLALVGTLFFYLSLLRDRGWL
jgi:hypothetical protein